jgi:hypothetical protein
MWRRAVFGRNSTDTLSGSEGGTMLRLTERQREMFVDKLPDLGNLAAAGLIFGQLLMERSSLAVALMGGLLWLTSVGFAAFIGRSDSRAAR